MCYNSTSPFFISPNLLLSYNWIYSEEGNYFFKKVDGFFKKGRPFCPKRSTFFVIVLSVMSASTKPKETTIEVVLRLLVLLISC